MHRRQRTTPLAGMHEHAQTTTNKGPAGRHKHADDNEQGTSGMHKRAQTTRMGNQYLNKKKEQKISSINIYNGIPILEDPPPSRHVAADYMPGR